MQFRSEEAMNGKSKLTEQNLWPKKSQLIDQHF